MIRIRSKPKKRVAFLQPYMRMIYSRAGIRKIAPIPGPEKTIQVARPLFFENQIGMSALCIANPLQACPTERKIPIKK